MPRVSLKVTRVNDVIIHKDGPYSEFAPMTLTWKEPGVVYRWCDNHHQVLPTRKRQGWKICNMQTDFLDIGCPEDSIPGETNAAGEIIFGDSILAKMPLDLYRKRYIHDTLDKINDRSRSNDQTVLAAGEDVVRTLRSRGVNVKGGNIVESISDAEERQDWARDYEVR